VETIRITKSATGDDAAYSGYGMYQYVVPDATGYVD
jgi:hypothetical protein